MRAEKQLTKTTERNVNIREKRVRPVKFHIGSKARYFRPCRYVDRGPKRRRNYSGPFWVVKIHSPEAVSVQRSQRSDVLLVPKENFKLFLRMDPCGWLDHFDGPSETRETGTTLAPGSCEHGRSPVRSPSEERQSLAMGITAACLPPSAWLTTVRLERRAGRASGLPCLVSVRLGPHAFGDAQDTSRDIVLNDTAWTGVEGPPDFAARQAGMPRNRFGVSAASA